MSFVFVLKCQYKMNWLFILVTKIISFSFNRNSENILRYFAYLPLSKIIAKRSRGPPNIGDTFNANCSIVSSLPTSI